MADLLHLEKMGRELKCPICLSLLKLAASLPCNHVFCNSCILESMKSVSDCPVCKVPFHRREVRSAPHMDNLVNIFKSMEVSLGVNILTTQVAPSSKNSDQITEVKKDSAKPRTVACRRKSKRKGTFKKNKSKQHKDDHETSDSHPATMPSFPAKKRIHVTPIPNSDTPNRPEKIAKLSTLDTRSEADNMHNKENLTTDKHGKLLLSPFFWLREENDDDNHDEALEEPSAQQTADTPPTNCVPCFSDIKDSEDEASDKMNPYSKPYVSKDFDSEMFEWTQRACSPELCSTPTKKQDQDYNIDSENEEKIEVLDKVAESGKNFNAKKGIPEKKKRPISINQRKEEQTSDSTTSGSALDKILPEIPNLSSDKAKNSLKKNKNTENERYQHPLRKCRKQRNKPASSYQTKRVTWTMGKMIDPETNEGAESLPKAGTCEASQIQEGNDTVLDNESKRKGRSKCPKLQPGRKRMKSLNEINTLEVPKTTENEAEKKTEEDQLLNIDFPAPCMQKQHDVCSRTPNDIQKQVGRSDRRSRIRTQVNVVENTKDSDKFILAPLKRCETENDQTSLDFQQKSGIKANKCSEKTQFLIPCSRGKILRCEKGNSQICCAFCQSSDDTEVSGQMMHYFNGKPVTAGYNGGASITHAHKHCIEWAPDVYFENDLPVNLASELARSKRIKCSCCGIRGAALGCFEKSCRKSFHFTCAKLIKECRWDNENFVVLCPLHSSLKLPNETPELQRKRNPMSKREPQCPLVCKSGHEMRLKWKWPCGTPYKWVLCCSALTNVEKDIIIEFTRLTGIPVSKSWSPTVTHVIAATDENGACRRTLKFLMGILEGKWILNIDWIKECLEAMEPVDEKKFEIGLDVHGIHGGPLSGRLRVINKQPKLFNGFRFYFNGDLSPSYKGYLQDLVIAAGGTVLQRKPISRDHKLLDDLSMQTTFIIYSLELPEKHTKNKAGILFSKQKEAQALADASGAKVAANTWILNSIAACELQPLV